MPRSLMFLCSGGGGNLKLVHSLERQGALPYLSTAAVIADRECPALEWAAAHGIHCRKVPYTRSHPDALREALAQLAPDLIVTNVHKILDDQIVSEYEGRLVNLHYSLLPSFAGTIGMESVRLARARGCRIVGATAHRVTADLDAGPILAQACVADDLEQPERNLYDAVFRCGGVALVAAMDGLVNSSAPRAGGGLPAGNLSIFAAPLPPENACDIFREEAFWERLR